MLAKAMKSTLLKTSGINNEIPHLINQPSRSGNIDTPVKPKFAKIMGQSSNPHGTAMDKVDRPPSYESTRPEMTNMGQPFERGISQDIIGDGMGFSLNKNGTADMRAKKEGPSEDPGHVRTGGLGVGLNKQGMSRYSG